MPAANEAIPFYEPGGRLTAHAAVAITGKRFVSLVSPGRQFVPPPTGTAQLSRSAGLSGEASGNNYKAGVPAAAAWCWGVASHDAAAGSKVTILCDPGMVVPVTAGAALTAGTEVQTDATGSAIPLAAGVPLGRVMADCPIGLDAEIKLR